MRAARSARVRGRDRRALRASRCALASSASRARSAPCATSAPRAARSRGSALTDRRRGRGATWASVPLPGCRRPRGRTLRGRGWGSRLHSGGRWGIVGRVLSVVSKGEDPGISGARAGHGVPPGAGSGRRATGCSAPAPGSRRPSRSQWPSPQTAVEEKVRDTKCESIYRALRRPPGQRENAIDARPARVGRPPSSDPGRAPCRSAREPASRLSRRGTAPRDPSRPRAGGPATSTVARAGSPARPGRCTTRS
jgi:hypothetical protein